MFTERQRRYLLFCHAFTGCDAISAIAGHGKSALFDKFYSGDIMDIFLDLQATKDEVVLLYLNAFTMHQVTTLGEIQYNMFLPPTEGAASQHSLCSYLQTRDWMLLQSTSLIPEEYGWIVGNHGYEPVPTLDSIAPEELFKFTSCNLYCNSYTMARRDLPDLYALA